MTFLQIYLYANLSILFFWVFYKIFLQNIKHFQANRLYIITALMVSTLIPFLQNALSVFLNAQETFINSNIYNFIYYSSNIGKSGEQVQAVFNSIDPLTLSKLIILMGAITSTVWFLRNHIRINQLIRRSKLLISDKTKILLSEENFVPFIYNRSIIIPDSVPPSDRDIIIRHESLHHKLAHHYDNLLIQLFQIIFWPNPFIYFIKRELSQLHEYQVDNQVVLSGINPEDYKFVLIRFRAGDQKFAVANGLKNSRIKKRIIMINTRISKKGNWRYLLLVPAFCLLLISMSFSNIKSRVESSAQIVPESTQIIDSVKIELITLPESYIIDHDKAVIVMINKVSDVAIEGIFTAKGQRVNQIIRKYNEHREKRFFNKLSPEVMIIIQKDMSTKEEDYEALLDEISTAIYTMHEARSQDLYSKSFSELKKEEQAKILETIPPEIHYAQPKKVTR